MVPRRFFALLLLTLGFLLPAALPAQSTQRVYLSGHDKDDAVAWKFKVSSGNRAGQWSTLPVPSQWDVHGFGTLNYRKDLPEAFNETGFYEHEFLAEKKWSGQRVFLVFEGAMTDTSAFINGKSAGPTHQGGFYQFKYEVTSLLNYGARNKLEVNVARHSANASVNNAERTADYWVLAGLYRPVYLEIQPREFIERVAINALANGEFTAEVYTNGAANAEVEVQVETSGGRTVASRVSAPLAESRATLSRKIDGPKLWSAETPNLYLARFRLKRDGRTIHEFTERFGFRTFEVRDSDGLYLNGTRIVLKGVNRHSFWPESGRTLSRKIHRLDIETMKDANMNAVRMSHYPPDREFLDLCDELGLYVLDELAGWQQHYDDAIGEKLARATVIRDVNHPSILFWDNGNESGFNLNLDRVFPEMDPQRRRVLHPWATFNGLNTAHYLVWNTASLAVEGMPLHTDLKNATSGYTIPERQDGKKYIYLPTEFQHGLYDGGAGAGFEELWGLMKKSPYLGGGFVWVFADEGLQRYDTGQIDTAGNQAPDGVVGPYREREGSFYTIKEVWSPLEFARNADGSFTVQNHYSFTPAAACKITWQLRRFDSFAAAGTTRGFKVLKEGRITTLDLAPGATTTLQLNLPRIEADALAIRAEDPTGRELWTWVWPLRDLGQGLNSVPTKETAKVATNETASSFVVTCGDLTVSIDKSTGRLAGVQRGGKPFSLTKGPFFTGTPGSLEKISAAPDASGDVLVTASYSGELKIVVWRVKTDGWLQCDYTYRAKGTYDFIGVTFDYPENLVQHKRWLGAGPFRVWKNRLRGTTLGVWENDYNNTITGYRGWVYPEFKGAFADVQWLQLTTGEGKITVVPRNVPYVQVLTPESPPKALVGQTLVGVPNCGLGFLQAISPIGSKFKPAKSFGPQSQLTSLDGEYSGSVSFFFGDLPTR